MRYYYPKYAVDPTPTRLAQYRGLAQRLREEVGMWVRPPGFIEAVRDHSGVNVEQNRIHPTRTLSDRFFDDYIKRDRKPLLEKADACGENASWSLRCNGFSIMVLDVETDQVRPATCQDLRSLIRLVRSFGMSGSYPCMPQDLPPLLRALECSRAGQAARIGPDMRPGRKGTGRVT